jgi:hypothetical protein
VRASNEHFHHRGAIIAAVEGENETEVLECVSSKHTSSTAQHCRFMKIQEAAFGITIPDKLFCQIIPDKLL